MYKTKSFTELAQIEADRWDLEERHIPSIDEIDTAATILSEYKNKFGMAAALARITMPPGIAATKISCDYMIVYWVGDPIVKELLAAGIMDLPKFLACADSEVREFAKEKLEFLEKWAQEKETNGEKTNN